MRSTFTPRARGGLLQGLYAGLTLGEAAERAGLPEQTAKNWLTRGRKDIERDTESEHALFARAVEEARDVAARADMTLPEFKGFLNRAVRAGSVAAMRLWLDVLDRERDGSEERDALDELKARHDERRGSVIDRLAHEARTRRMSDLDRLDAGLDYDNGELTE